VLLSDIWPTAWTCLDFAGFQPGDSVAVFGAGPVGLLCAYSAILRGASKVYSIDSVPARLEKARSIGSVPINFTKGDPVQQILKLEPDGVTRTCDCVGFECVNDNLKPDEGIIIQRAVELTTSGGGIGVAGVYLAQDKSRGAPDAQGKRAANIKFPISDFWSKNLRMQAGIVLGRVMAPTLLRLIESGKAKPSFIFTAEYKIEEAQKAYTRFSEHKEIKVSFKFPYNEAIEEEHNGTAQGDNADRRTKRRRV
jgi:threonine dehydrogenase-like Zn-dependent dehydrogenase